MSEHGTRSPHGPAGATDLTPPTTAHRDVLQVRVRPRTARATGPGAAPAGDAVALAWSCVESFAGPGDVLLGAGGPAAPDADRLVAEGLAVAAELTADGARSGGDLVVLVARGRPPAFARATRSPRLRVVLVDDAPGAPHDLQPWTGCLDGHAVVVTRPGQLAGAVCEALVHDGPALVHVHPAV